MNHPKVKFAVVGAGFIGRRHASIIQQHPEAELIALVDTNTNLQPMLEQEFKVPFFRSLDDLLSAELAIDVINICTPNYLHALQSVQALTYGSHVVCEKPMALTRKDCEAVIQQAKEADKLVFCVMQNRYSPPSVWLKELVSSGKLGQIYMVQIDCYWNRDERYYQASTWKGKLKEDGGTLFTQFSHFVDLMYWLFGDITNINARFRDFNHQHLTAFEDSGFVSFDFVKGGMGTINYSTAVWDKNMESSLTIIAENGSVKVGGQYVNEVVYCHVKDYQMPELQESLPPNDYGHYKGSAANHHFVIKNVVDTLCKRTTATTNAQEGLMVVDIIERIYQLK